MSDAPPYLAEYRVGKDFAFPDGFSVESFEGLVSCVLVTHDVQKEESHVLCTWRSQSDFARNSGPLVGQLTSPQQVAPQLAWDGFHTAERRKPRRFKDWWKLRWSQVVGVLAIVGTLQAFSVVTTSFFGSPDVYVKRPAGPMNFVMGDPILIPLEVKNVDGDGACELAIDDTITVKPRNPAQPATLEFASDYDKRFPSLAVGETQAIRIPGSASGPGSHEVTVIIKAAQGRLLPWWTRHPCPISVEVWRNVELTRRTVTIRGSTAKRCVVGFSGKVGAHFPKGLRFHPQLLRQEDVRFEDYVHYPSLVRWEKVVTVDKNTPDAMSTISWNTPPVGPFQPIEFELRLEGDKPRNQGEWTAIVNEIKFGNIEGAP